MNSYGNTTFLIFYGNSNILNGHKKCGRDGLGWVAKRLKFLAEIYIFDPAVNHVGTYLIEGFLLLIQVTKRKKPTKIIEILIFSTIYAG